MEPLASLVDNAMARRREECPSGGREKRAWLEYERDYLISRIEGIWHEVRAMQ